MLSIQNPAQAAYKYLNANVLKSGNRNLFKPFSHNSKQTNLVSSLLGAQPEVGDVDRLCKTSLGRGIKHLVERDVLEHLVHSQFVWVDHHRKTVFYGLE